MNPEKKLMELTLRDCERYKKQISIPNFGRTGQRKLKSSTVLIAGSGGLGSAVSIYLAVAGIGKLKIVDNDIVELSNLNRQILFEEKDLGKSKAILLRKMIRQRNKDIRVEAINKEITDETIGSFAGDCDLIVDCLDNYATRYILNRISNEKKIPLFHAAIRGMYGQATTIIPGETACLKCIFPNPPPPEESTVLGATPGLLGTIQVHEVIKYIVGMGKLLKNELLIVNRGTEFEKLKVKKNPKCEVCK